ncbi:alpha/beta-hydrolase family protein, partial [Leucobacter soli]
RLARRALLIVSIAGSAVLLWLAHGWQQAQREQIGLDPAPASDPVLATAVALVAFGALLIIARGIRGGGRRLGRLIARVLPLKVAVALGTVLAVWAAYALVNGVMVGRVAETLDATYLAINDEFSTDVPAPELAEVSGGPGSAVSWESLGRQGRVFIANTPTREEIGGFLSQTGARNDFGPYFIPAQPIRVYIGSGPEHQDLDAQVAQAVAELERTGAFERAVLNVATGTGRGWVNENQARALEYLWRGSTATVSVQYSYLPSWMSFLVDGDRPRQAGQALFDAVYARWSQLPEDARPKLLVSGESLGSFGSEGAFAGAQDLATRTDGALWVGPTANNVLWQRFTEDRDAGSPVSLPVHAAGDTVRFSADGAEWPGAGEWAAPRVGYLQHANDPVTWLDFGAVFERPEFLSGERGPGVPDQMIWIPVVTVLQLAVDQLASGIPDGQGHEFGQAPVRAWAEILPPPAWDESDTEALAAHLAELRLDDLDSAPAE